MDTEYPKNVLQIQTLCGFLNVLFQSYCYENLATLQIFIHSVWEQGTGQDPPLVNIKRVLCFCGACSRLSLITENVD